MEFTLALEFTFSSQLFLKLIFQMRYIPRFYYVFVDYILVL